MEGYSVRQLAHQSKHGLRQLKRIISHWLLKPPSLDSLKRKAEKTKYMLFDGTYFNKSNCVLGLMDDSTNDVLSLTYGKGETYDHCYHVFKELRDTFKLHPVAITLDGNNNVTRAVKAVWPSVVIQRCLVHIQRQGLAWLRRKPKLVLALELRSWFLDVTNIQSQGEKEHFIQTFYAWLTQHASTIKSFSKTDKVSSDFLRAVSLLVHAIPDMFHYLDDERIPPTTNKMEGFFSRLKGHYRNHRGLRVENRQHYFSWYWYYLSKNN
jgi:hypothetical protein